MAAVDTRVRWKAGVRVCENARRGYGRLRRGRLQPAKRVGGRAGRAGKITLWLAVPSVLVLAPVGWLASDALERNNDFCNACHVDEDTRLHIDLRRDFDARPAMTLAAAHAAAEPAALLCIDCHGGVGAIGRARVKALAAKDAFFWGIGRFEEPHEMTHPLWDADCLRCHRSFDETADANAERRFHALGVHNAGLGIACVDCHTSHVPGGEPGFHFLQTGRVRERCAGCHVEFANTGRD